MTHKFFNEKGQLLFEVDSPSNYDMFSRHADTTKAEPVQEPIGYVSGVYGGYFTVEPLNPALVLTPRMALYAAAPQAKAEPVQEPVGYVYSQNGRKEGCIQDQSIPNGTPLYAAAPVQDQIQRITAMESALCQARWALCYHTDQTRPIFETQKAITAIDALGVKE
jgi:hypothetical protein